MSVDSWCKKNYIFIQLEADGAQHQREKFIMEWGRWPEKLVSEPMEIYLPCKYALTGLVNEAVHSISAFDVGSRNTRWRKNTWKSDLSFLRLYGQWLFFKEELMYSITTFIKNVCVLRYCGNRCPKEHIFSSMHPQPSSCRPFLASIWMVWICYSATGRCWEIWTTCYRWGCSWLPPKNKLEVASIQLSHMMSPGIIIFACAFFLS